VVIAIHPLCDTLGHLVFVSSQRLCEFQIIAIRISDNILPGTPGSVSDGLNYLCSVFYMKVEGLIRVGHPNENIWMERMIGNEFHKVGTVGEINFGSSSVHTSIYTGGSPY
jgi:hypothetical protein